MFNLFKKKTPVQEKILISNLYTKEDLFDVTGQVLDQVYAVLSNSYGSIGASSIISNGNDTPSISKDGLRILRSIKFEDPMARDVYNLIIQISSSLVDKVGDGSTSAVITARNIFNNIKDLDNGVNDSKELTKILSMIQAIVEKIIKVYFTKDITTLSSEEKEEVFSIIAGISNNNDFDIGSQIAKIIGNLTATSAIKIKENPQDNSAPISYNYSYGYPVDNFRIAHSLYFSGNFKNGYELAGKTAPYILMAYNFTKEHYDYLRTSIIGGFDDTTRRPVVIIAETVDTDVNTEVIKGAVADIASGRIPGIFLFTTNSLTTEFEATNFSDLAVYVNADPLAFTELDSTKNFLGICGKLTINANNKLSFEHGWGISNGTDDYNNLVEELNKIYLETPNNHKAQKGSIRNRINKLSGVNATIFVGGRTNEEKENLKYLVEDSVLACQSVLRNGYTIGGNITPLYALAIAEAIILEKGNGIATSHDYDVSGNEYFAIIKDVLSLYEKYPNSKNVIQKLIESYAETALLPINKYNLDNSEALDFKSTITTCFVKSNIIDFDIEGVAKDPLMMNSDAILQASIYNSFSEKVETFVTDKENIENTDMEVIVETTVLAPVNTDIEILRATFSIVSLILSSNQYLG